ncbi:hypothetical protein D9M68_760510 [compost metagenome]
MPIPGGRPPPCAARWPHVRWRCRQHAQAVETFETAARFAVLVVSFPGRTRVHPPHPQGTYLPCGRESLGCHKESPHGYPSHPRTDADARCRSCAFQRPFVQVQHLRRSAQGFDAGLSHRPEAFRGQGHRHHRRGHRRQDGTSRVRGARSNARDRGARRGRQGAGRTLCQTPLRRSAGGHARGTHRVHQRRPALQGEDACARFRTGEAADPGTPLPGVAGTGQSTGAVACT